jgi:hypothetical protein
MKYLITMLAMAISLATFSQPKTLVPGSLAPAFNLPDVSGKNISFTDFN